VKQPTITCSDLSLPRGASKAEKRLLISRGGKSRGFGPERQRHTTRASQRRGQRYDLRPGPAEKAAADIGKHRTGILATPADLTDAGEVQKAVDGRAQKFGCLDILINNASDFDFE
jgi:NAD(P)-dependent dehydrogenase (short-subunit alcohol dehydrogenase family)